MFHCKQRTSYIAIVTCFQVHTHLHTRPGVCWRAWLCLSFSLTEMLRGKPPVPDTLSQSQIGGEASSSRLNYTGETRNSSSAEAAWTRRKNTPRRVATEQSTRLVQPGSPNGVKCCRLSRRALVCDKEIIWTWPLVTKGWRVFGKKSNLQVWLERR